MKLTQQLEDIGACQGAQDWVTQNGYETLGEAWSECQRADWMLWLVERVGACKQGVLNATMEIAALALEFMPNKPTWAAELEHAAETDLEWWLEEKAETALRLANGYHRKASMEKAYFAASAIHWAFLTAESAIRYYGKDENAYLVVENVINAHGHAIEYRKLADIVRKHVPVDEVVDGFYEALSLLGWDDA